MINNKERIGFFFFYDKEGIVDEYVYYLLNGISAYINELCVVINGKIIEKDKEKLKNIANKVIVRENKGFDVWAYKEAMDSYGWDKIASYDELIMFNFTIYGPLYPFSEMFQKMDSFDYDFWGITKHRACKQYGHELAEHIQSHFIVVRKNILDSDEFRKYWEELEDINSYEDAVCKHEAKFTKYFSDLGYKWSVYIDPVELDESIIYPLMTVPQVMLQHRCPILKRKMFFMYYIQHLVDGNYGENTIKALEIIKRDSDYDTNLITDNLLRTSSITAVNDNTHRGIIIINEESKAKDDNKTLICIINKDTLVKDKYIKYEKYADIIVIDDIINLKILLELKDKYDEICILLESEDEELNYRLRSNLLLNEEYIGKVKNKFFENPKIGLMTISQAYHKNSLDSFAKGIESEQYEHIKEVAIANELNFALSNSDLPINLYGLSGWYRMKAFCDAYQTASNLRNCCENDYDYIIPLLIQRNGYEIKYLYSESFAKLEMINMTNITRLLLKNVSNQYHINHIGDVNYYINDCISNINQLRNTLNDREVELDKLKEYTKKLEKDFEDYKEEASDRINKLQEVNIEAKQFIDKTAKENLEAREYITSLEKDVAEAREYIKKLEKDYVNQQEELNKTVDKRDEFISKSHQLEHLLESIQESKSWKLTKPIRMITDKNLKVLDERKNNGNS